jgi:hypothetical protein
MDTFISDAWQPVAGSCRKGRGGRGVRSGL